MNSDYNDLISYVKRTEALAHGSSLIAWDQETMMPKGSVSQRADCLAAIESEIHKRRSNLKIEDLLSKIDIEKLNNEEKANYHHIKRSYERSSKIPNDLATEITRICSLSQMSWVEARKNNNPDEFFNYFKEVINLKRREAEILSNSDNVYDALIDDFEPGMTSKKLDEIFNRLRNELIRLRNIIFEKKEIETKLNFSFNKILQLEISNKLANIFGYDFNIGRIDESEHPFSTGSGNDVRITTRIDNYDPFNCFYSTIHETGHAVYEQRIPKSLIYTPNGQGASMAVHESQSRIFENQFGRSKEFCDFLYKMMVEKFGHFEINNEEDFYLYINKVENSFIRTEADEVNYNLHILMRYDLEKDLINGSLKVQNIEESWNERFKNDFGVEVNNSSDGFMQDVHWSAGLFGYFPTYTLGNIYAGCLYDKILNDVKPVMSEVQKGDLSSVIEWLTNNIYSYGSIKKPEQLIADAIGRQPDEKPLINYLNNKFL